MTDTEAALLRAIAANRDEDTPRLVFADYLDELGEPSRSARAEFIRLHVHTTRLPADAPEREIVRRRIDQLLWKWDFVWQKEMPPGFKPLSGYRRGFAYRAAATASAIRSTEDPRTLLIEHLELTVDVSATGLRAVLNCPLFARLTELLMRGEYSIGWSGVKALAECEYPLLERLDLARQRIGDIGLRWLCNSWGFPQLRALDISSNEITDSGATTLLRSALLPRLERLSIRGNPISQTMMDRLRPGGRVW